MVESRIDMRRAGESGILLGALCFVVFVRLLCCQRFLAFF